MPRKGGFPVGRIYLADAIMDGMKTCSKCGIDKPLSCFAKREGASDGHRGQCYTCMRERRRVTNAPQTKQISEYMKAYRQANKERITAQKKAWVESNREYVRELERKYAVSNAVNKEAARQKWKIANPDKDRAAKAANRADRIRRVPAWASRERIKAYYNVCAFFNEVNGYAKYHVDHIIPLNGKTVSGLHVHNNLQVIPAEENLRKGARYG